MIFDEFPLDEAEGLVLAHTTTQAGAKLVKGRRLGAEDVALLRRGGAATVVGCRIEADDLAENEAAHRVAAALAGDTVMAGPAAAGRCNLFAREAGLLTVERDRVNRLNRVDEAIAVATLPPWTVVAPRQRIATVKVMPFAVAAGTVAACVAAAREPSIAVRPFRPLRVGLIATTAPRMNEELLLAAIATNRGRVEALGSEVALELRCPHDTAAIADALRRALGHGCTLVLIAGAQMTTDRRDTVPRAVVDAGGAIVHFGMPVEPGNMLMTARVGTVPVLSLPGCTRTPGANGLDWVLHRLMAGLPVTAGDLMDMGVGGLLEHGPE